MYISYQYKDHSLTFKKKIPFSNMNKKTRLKLCFGEIRSLPVELRHEVLGGYHERRKVDWSHIGAVLRG